MMANDEEIIVDAEVWEPEQEDNIMLLSCKKCGNTVPAHYEFCPYCKKRLQKRKRKKSKVVLGLVITLLSLSTIASTLCAITYYNLYAESEDYYDLYIETKTKNNILTDKLIRTKKLYNELSQQQETNANTHTSVSIETPKPTIKAIPQATVAPTPIPQPKVCAVESCSNPLEQYETHIYCNLHECEEYDCMGYRDDPLSAYCAAHRCVRPGCHAKRGSGYDICINHKYE